MAEPALKRRFNEAKGAADMVINHSKDVYRRIGPPKASAEAERVRDSMMRANESLRSVAAQGRRIGAVVKTPEERYREAEMGRSRPARVFRTLQEARRHSAEDDAENRARLLMRYPTLDAARIPRGTVAGAVGKTLPSQAPAGSVERMGAEALFWISKDALGPRLSRILAAAPPIMTGESHRFFLNNSLAEGSGANTAIGLYFPGTNHIAIDIEKIRDDSGKVDYLRSVVAHEMLHYMAHLGGGDRIRWRDDTGKPVFVKDKDILHEGMTELLAQQMVRDHGFDPGSVSYGPNVTVAYYMSMLVGDGVFRDAYFSGDFSKVRSVMDARLGKGAFDSLMACPSADAALDNIRDRVKSQGMGKELAFWDEHPIVRTAGAVS